MNPLSFRACRKVVLTIAAVVLTAGSVPASASVAPLMIVKLTPGAMDENRGVGHLDVTLRIPEMDVPAGAPLLSLPLVVANADTIATTVEALTATDGRGAIPLTIKDDDARYWLAGRRVQGDVTVTYRAPIDDTPPARGSAPPYSLRTEGGGFSGVGNVFFLLPEASKPYRIALRWDLSAMGKDATATSSYGEGDVEIEAGPAGRLNDTVFMAGPMHREPSNVVNGGFSSAWLGQPPFDPRPLMTWTMKLHAWMSVFFKDSSEPPYRVFIRYNPINAGGGTALTRSFLTTYGARTDPESLKSTLSHEMVHTWTHSAAGMWYAEGIAVHYQALLPLRAGLLSPADYLADLNETARRYYSNSLNTTPDDQIAARFWEDTRIRVLPYDRGRLYLDMLDAQIRRVSGGKRSLDDVVLEMNSLDTAGGLTSDEVFDRNSRHPGAAPTSDEAFLKLVAKELGADPRPGYSAMMAGGLVVPDSDAYGPCFTRVTGKVRRFELGFDPKSLVGGVKTIRGLIPGSEAARAGIRNGDIVTYAVALDSVQGDPNQTLTFRVTRDGGRFPLTYLPRGDVVDVYQWARAPGVPDSDCHR